MEARFSDELAREIELARILASDLSQRVNRIVGAVRAQRPGAMPLYTVRQGGAAESKVLSLIYVCVYLCGYVNTRTRTHAHTHTHTHTCIYAYMHMQVLSLMAEDRTLSTMSYPEWWAALARQLA